MALPRVLEQLPALSERAAEGEEEAQRELAALADLQARLGYEFARPELLRVALTLGSWANENRGAGWPSNACLEFFGDAVLGLAAADALWQRFADAGEGMLTRLRATLVSEGALAERARALDLGGFLYVGRGDERRGARDRDGTLSDAFEAVVGAVFLDARREGRDPAEAATRCFAHLFARRLEEIEPEDGIDVKSRLQQLVQGELRLTPVYVQVGRPPPPDAPHWRARVEVRHPDGRVDVLGEGEGRSLRDAERDAARRAIAKRRS